MVATALEPQQWVVFQPCELPTWAAVSNYRGEWEGAGMAVQALFADLADQLIIGGFRSSKQSPGRLFYCLNQDVGRIAPLLVADSKRSGHRGYPSIIDIVDRLAGVFSAANLRKITESNYSINDALHLYRDERLNRPRRSL